MGAPIYECVLRSRCFTKFYSVVSEELHLQTVSVVYLILAKLPSSKGAMPYKPKEKDWIKTSCEHYVIHNYKISRNSVSGFRGVALTNCFKRSIVYFQLRPEFPSSKRAYNSQEKKWVKISCKYAHLHSMSFIITKFCCAVSEKCADQTKKTPRTDWQTGQKLLPSPIVVWGIPGNKFKY